MSNFSIIASANMGSGSSFSGPSGTVQLFFEGDSITAGKGTTGTGSSSTDTSLSGAGTMGYPKQALALLGNSSLVTGIIEGHSGQNAQWYNGSPRTATIALFSGTVHRKIVVFFYGANDVTAWDTTTIYNSFISAYNAFRSAGAKVIIVPIIPRGGPNTVSGSGYVGSGANFEAGRTALNNALISGISGGSPIADAIVDTSGYGIWSSTPPDATYFAGAAGVADVDGFVNTVHPNDTGAGQIAAAVAAAVRTLW